ncbi:VOC family protein [Sedimentitalea sp. XS_ASV28]|uniref:VOC family protein n=1 Tax=Sedimentitalea sp. XS_ASV28 TaxID=3241296 RepID=UPI0035153EBA
MKVLRLDHVNVRTTKLTEMVEFYEDILGLSAGARPDFPFPGAWIYVGDHPAIHLVGVKEECAAIEPRIEHFAFQATGLSRLRARLRAADIRHTIDPVPGVPIVQVNLEDVDGNHIHIDFHSDELDADG